MKRWMSIACSFALLVGLAACGDQNKGEDQKMEVGLGTVNGVELDAAEYQLFYDMYLGMIAKQQMLSDNVKNMLVDEAIIKQDLEKNKVEVSKELIEEVRKELIESLGGEAGYKDRLAEDGVSDAAFDALVKMRAYSKAHIDWYKANHPISPEEMAKYYEEHKMELDSLQVSHILVDNEEQANAVKARLDAGEDFAKLAQELSLDEITKTVGGDLGEINPNFSGLDSSFLGAVQALQEGEISGPVQTQFGFHIIKLVSRKDSIEELKDEIEKNMFQVKYGEYTEQLKAKAEVKLTGQKEEKQPSPSTEAPAEGEAPAEASSEAPAENQQGDKDAPAAEEDAAKQ